jgi:S1-C subfamily serine protease
MIENRQSDEAPESTQLVRVAPEAIPQPRFPALRAALWWVLPATAMLAGGWTAAMVLVAAGNSAGASVRITCGMAAAVAVFGGMCLFERLFGSPGAALGAGVTVQLIHSPFVEYAVIPGWSASAGWLITAAVTGVLAWRVHTRRPPLLRTADPLVVDRAALTALTGAAPGGPASVAVSGRFRLTGWPRTALQAVELPGHPPAEIDAVASVETSVSRGTAFMIRNDGRHADLVTNAHLFTTTCAVRSGTARVSIAGATRQAVLLPRPDPDRFAQLLADLDPRADRVQLRRLAEETDLRLIRIDATGLPAAPLEISTADRIDALALSVGYPQGGVPRFVWPASPVPLPVIGIGRLVLHAGCARLCTPWRIQSGSSGGPVLVREGDRLRVAAVTYLQHAARASRGDTPHIPAPVLRAYVDALDGAPDCASGGVQDAV